MKRLLLLTVLVLLSATVAQAQVTTVVGSKHDFSGDTGTAQVCVFCHTPHQRTGDTQDPLWNHELSTVTSYGTYQSTTMNHTAVEIGGTTSASLLCMSCHDGTIAVINLWNDPNDEDPVALTGNPTWGNSTGIIDTNALLGTDLTNDHPINFTYDDTLDPDLNANPGNNVLRGGTVQCSSCHDPHKSADNYGFFRVTMNSSTLCTTCHDK